MNLLEARNLNKQFGRVKALDNISIGLRRHEILAIVGESGSGKTTLLNTLAGNITADSGEVYYDRGEGLCADLRARRARAAPPAARAMGLHPAGSAPGAAAERHRRRQYRRAADGRRRAALRQYP